MFHPDRDLLWWNLVLNRPVLEDGTMFGLDTGSRPLPETWPNREVSVVTRDTAVISPV